MSAKQFELELSSLIKARFPIIYVITWEEKRLIESINNMVNNKQLFSSPRPVWEWSVTEGLMLNGKTEKADIKTSMRVLEFIDQQRDNGIFILKDLYSDLSRPSYSIDHAIIRKLKNLIWKIKQENYRKTIIISAHDKFIPEDLKKEILIKEFDLPTKSEIKDVLLSLIKQNKHNSKLQLTPSEETIDKLCDAACGLTLHEAENAFALSIVKDGELNESDITTILDEKKQIIQRNGLLEFSTPNLKFDDIGGLENLKRWLLKRNDSWSDKAKLFNIPAPKGVLLTGLPGCGKSLMAKTISSLWNLPLLRLDIGTLFEGLVGSSERNMRNVIQTAEAMAPCVLWIDEIEKAFAGIGSSGDSGVSTRIFGTFLTWMQEKEKFVFVAATANRTDSLPPELMRKGRFDEIFFIDLPTKLERKVILNIHLKKRLNKPEICGDLEVNDALINKLVDMTEGFTGSELEQLVITALFEAFGEKRSVTLDDFIHAIQNTVSLRVTQAEEIERIRRWANQRAVSATSDEYREENKICENEPDVRGGRNIEF